jgi:5-methylcytosine-specific restriction endonuclease McrA
MMAVKKARKKPKFNQNSAIRSSIRRMFSRSPDVIETLKKVRREREWFKKDGTSAKKPRVEYSCSNCNEWFMGKDVQVDHTVPVISPEKGFETWDIFVERLFCGADNLAVLCKPCHKIKTDSEKAIRAEYRKKAKLATKE